MSRPGAASDDLNGGTVMKCFTITMKGGDGVSGDEQVKQCE